MAPLASLRPSALAKLRVASLLSQAVPLSALNRLAEAGAGVLGPQILSEKGEHLGDNLERVHSASVAPLIADLDSFRLPISDDARAMVRRGFGSYGRYWAESFRLPHLDSIEIDRGFSFVGYRYIEAARASGIGPILVLPHLGGWEWAAAWLAMVNGVGVTAVVERLEPPEVFEWFHELRRRYGVNVVPTGPGAMTELVAAAKRRDVICLPADRDIGGTGIPIEFFGRTASVPVGPAVLARRTGAPIVPAGVFFRGRQRIAVVTEPILVEGKGRSENVRLTTAAVRRMEQLITSAPDQWHVLEPMWPS